MKHKKGQCAIFIESRLPCEDCDLEGHSATCGWHIDFSRCDCHAFLIHNLEYEVSYYVSLLKKTRNEFSNNHRMIKEIDDTLKKFNR